MAHPIKKISHIIISTTGDWQGIYIHTIYIAIVQFQDKEI